MEILQYQKEDTSAPTASTAAQYGYAVKVYGDDKKSTAKDSKDGRNLIASMKDSEKLYGPAGQAMSVTFDGISSKLPGVINITSGGKSLQLLRTTWKATH